MMSLRVLVLCLGMLAARQSLVPEGDASPLATPVADVFGTPLRPDTATACLFVALAPECPLCNEYVPRLNELAASAAQHGATLIGLAAGTEYSSEEVQRWAASSAVSFPVVLDTALSLLKTLELRVTPEVAVVKPDGEVVYRGALDDRAVSLTRRRKVSVEYYAQDALHYALGLLPQAPTRHIPVGCPIEGMRQ